MRPVASAPSTRTWLLVAAALALYYVMAVSVSPRLGVTADEVVHLTGGYSYWKFNDYRLHPENGTLPMRVAALPLLAMDLKFPPLEGNPDWLRSQVNTLGDRFFFGLGNPLENGDRLRLNPLGEAAGGDQGADIAERSVAVVIGVVRVVVTMPRSCGGCGRL